MEVILYREVYPLEFVLNELFKKVTRNSFLKLVSFRREFRVPLLALSGPAYILCPLQMGVKDMLVHNCAKLKIACPL